jgi:hypothetical protein
MVQCVCNSFVLLKFLASISFDYSISQLIVIVFGNFINGSDYCWVFYFVQLLNIVYRSVSGLGMALIRVLYIRKGTWVRFKIGETALLGMAGAIHVVVSTLLIVLYGVDNISNRSMFNICMGYTQTFQVSASSKNLFFIINYFITKNI